MKKIYISIFTIYSSTLMAQQRVVPMFNDRVVKPTVERQATQQVIEDFDALKNAVENAAPRIEENGRQRISNIGTHLKTAESNIRGEVFSFQQDIRNEGTLIDIHARNLEDSTKHFLRETEDIIHSEIERIRDLIKFGDYKTLRIQGDRGLIIGSAKEDRYVLLNYNPLTVTDLEANLTLRNRIRLSENALDVNDLVVQIKQRLNNQRHTAVEIENLLLQALNQIVGKIDVENFDISEDELAELQRNSRGH